MSANFEQEIRTIVSDEIEQAISPYRQVLEKLSALLGGATGGTLSARRGPGRPPGSGRRGGPGRKAGPKKACAVIGCSRPSMSKGYCAAHYQKLRNLTKTKRRPSDWKDHADPQTVKDIVLPRGRAAVNALKRGRGRGSKA